MGNTIIIDDGFKTYDIKNKEGKLLGQFSFNPSDINIVKRYNKAVGELDSLFSEIGNEEDEDFIKVVEMMDEKVHKIVDDIFNAEISDNFFSIMGALSPLADGRFFIESVLEAIGQAINAETGERVKKLERKIKKHTSKYHK